MTDEKILNELPKMLRGYADMLDENISLTEQKEILEEAIEYANPYYTVAEFIVYVLEKEQNHNLTISENN